MPPEPINQSSSASSGGRTVERSARDLFAIRPLDAKVVAASSSTSSSPRCEAKEHEDEVGNFSHSSTFDTFLPTSSSAVSLEKLKSFRSRIRSRLLSRATSEPILQHPAAEVETARVGPGLWKDQLLVDRSLRTMAVTMSIFALFSVVLVTAYASHFRDRANLNSTSVGGDAQSCKDVTTANTVILLLINIFATMILGMSNTYQQLVTSLNIEDLKYALSRFGDSRVGTNSPFSINHKQAGKKHAWSAWIFLVVTSLPIHFLANSLIGPSYIQKLPEVVEFVPASFNTSFFFPWDQPTISDRMSFPCWSAFRTGIPHYPQSTFVMTEDKGIFSAEQNQFGSTWKTMRVLYRESCAPYVKTATNLTLLETSFYFQDSSAFLQYRYSEGECRNGDSVMCTLHDPQPALCRLNVRMSAAFILMSCLVIKAAYMCTVNLLARGKKKTQCLTFGDVIVASATHDELRVQGECMVNAGDNYRRSNSHACHKHCRNATISISGDETGHCQKCRKYNSTNRFTHDPQPTIATKFKKSLIASLGTTALTQMCLLVFCTLLLVGASATVAFFVQRAREVEERVCAVTSYKPGPNDYPYPQNAESSQFCRMKKLDGFEYLSGGFGGFNRSLTLASMAPNDLRNEVISFSISNGAQFIYSCLYLLLIYNITLISQELDWGKLQHTHKRIRCTLVKGPGFSQDYLLQLPKRILIPTMTYSVLTHWILGEALQTQEAVWLEDSLGRRIEHSKYIITYAAYPIWIATFLVFLMTAVCWWAFTFTREGFIPQMYGSVRTLCAATSRLDDFPANGVKWGALESSNTFRHAGLSARGVQEIAPNELYA